jgi:isoleucyl-tRNA synthetase
VHFVYAVCYLLYLCVQGGKGRADCLAALTTLFHVLLTVTKVMAPFTPFICETMYRNLRAALVAAQQQQQGGAAAAEVPESVHWCDMPAVEQVRGSGLRFVLLEGLVLGFNLFPAGNRAGAHSCRVQGQPVAQMMHNDWAYCTVQCCIMEHMHAVVCQWGRISAL